MEVSKVVELTLTKVFEEIGLERLKAFPFWVSTPELDIDRCYWSEIEPPEGVELAYGESFVSFPEDFSEQRLFDDEGNIDFWTSDLIELSQKHNGILFICEGSTEFEFDNSDYGVMDTFYPAVFVHLRFKSELDRLAAIREIRNQQKNPTLFSGQYPEER
jgi:hypothetical protein